MNTIIYHIDVNSAFLSWEAAYRLHHLGGTLDLRTIPSAVSGDVAARHGIILAKSTPAKRFGIHTGQTVLEARQKCPSLYMVPPQLWTLPEMFRCLYQSPERIYAHGGTVQY